MQRLAKLNVHHNYCDDSFPDKSFHHNYFSTIPVTFIVKLWSTSIETISSGTMKEDSLNDCKVEVDAEKERWIENKDCGSRITD